MNNKQVSQNPAKTGPATFLALDFGQSKIGLAIADEETKMAFAFDVLKNDKEFWPSLKEIIKCENVKFVVIGMTQHAKDPQSAQEKIRFGEKITKEMGVEVFFHEEMFTTKMAQANLKQRGDKNIGQKDDSEAARIILQSWLDN